MNTNVDQISTEELDLLLGSAPSSTPSANTLAISKDETQTLGGIEKIELEDLDEIDEKKVEEVKDPAKPEEKKEEKPEEVVEEEVKETPSDVKSVLKTTVDYFIDNGFWDDFEGRDEMEFDEKTYAELAKAQEEKKLSDKFNELVDSTGAYGQAIINHIKNGGNPEAVIDIFKEQKEVEAIDISTDEGKLDLLGRYYSEIVGWKPEKVTKYLKRILDGEKEDFDAEINEVKEKYDEYYTNQLEEIQVETKKAQEAEKKRQEEFKTEIKEAIKTSEYTDKEKRFIEKSLLEFKHKLPNGAVVNDFFIKFAEMQKNPKDYVEFVLFTMDKANYIKKMQAKAETKAAVITFNFVKNNSSTSKTSGTKHITPEDNKTQRINFGSLLQK